MEQVEIYIGDSVAAETLPELIETCMASYGLKLRMRGTLRTYAGSLHWHFEKPGERGILEVTLWPARQRLWLSVQAGRRAEWIEDALPQIKADIEKQIAAS